MPSDYPEGFVPDKQDLPQGFVPDKTDEKSDTSASTGGSNQNTKSFNEQLTEQRPLQPFDSAHPIKSIARDVGTELGNVGAGGINSIESMAHPIDTAKSMFKGIPAALKSVGNGEYPTVDPGYAVGSVIPFLGAGEAVTKIPDMADAATHPMETFRDAKDFAASKLRNPATARQSQMVNPDTGLGKPGTVKTILPPQLQKWTVPDWMIPKGRHGTPTNPGMNMEIPLRLKGEQAAEYGLSREGGITPQASIPNVNVVPEPRPEFQGENPNYMASVKRSTLPGLARNAKPGAATQLQNLGKTIIYAPREGVGYPGPREQPEEMPSMKKKK